MRNRRFRMIASNPLSQNSKDPGPGLEELQKLYDMRSHIPAKLHDLGWSSWFRINSRMVNRLQTNRIFLGGDSAHIHRKHAFHWQAGRFAFDHPSANGLVYWLYWRWKLCPTTHRISGKVADWTPPVVHFIIQLYNHHMTLQYVTCSWARVSLVGTSWS
jgi:hypothetical protein